MSYAEMIIKAAQESNISAFYIKSKIIQEVGSQGSGSVSGTYPGYEDIIISTILEHMTQEIQLQMVYYMQKIKDGIVHIKQL